MQLFRLFTACVIAAVPSFAQPFAQNPRNLVLAHIDLNSADPTAATAFWKDVIGGSIVNRGPLNGVGMIGAWIVFIRNVPTGPSAGSAIDHLGLKVPDLQPFIERLAKTTFKSFQPKAGEDVLMIDGPDGVRVELIQDSSMYSPLEFDHIHLHAANVKDSLAWYTTHLGARPNPDDEYSVRLSGANLTFTQADSVLPTAGRAIDRLTFEVKDPAGVTVLTDPSGTRIELSAAH